MDKKFGTLMFTISQSPVIVSDDHIFENDMCIDVRDGRIWENVYGMTGSVIGNKEYLKKNFKKIIVDTVAIPNEFFYRIKTQGDVCAGDKVEIWFDNGAIDSIHKLHKYEAGSSTPSKLHERCVMVKFTPGDDAFVLNESFASKHKVKESIIIFDEERFSEQIKLDDGRIVPVDGPHDTLAFNKIEDLFEELKIRLK